MKDADYKPAGWQRRLYEEACKLAEELEIPTEGPVIIRWGKSHSEVWEYIENSLDAHERTEGSNLRFRGLTGCFA